MMCEQWIEGLCSREDKVSTTIHGPLGAKSTTTSPEFFPLPLCFRLALHQTPWLLTSLAYCVPISRERACDSPCPQLLKRSLWSSPSCRQPQTLAAAPLDRLGSGGTSPN